MLQYIVLAEAAPDPIQSALSTAFTSIASDLTSTITTVAPIALGVLGMGIVLTFGVKWFKRLTNKA